MESYEQIREKRHADLQRLAEALKLQGEIAEYISDPQSPYRAIYTNHRRIEILWHSNGLVITAPPTCDSGLRGVLKLTVPTPATGEYDWEAIAHDLHGKMQDAQIRARLKKQARATTAAAKEAARQADEFERRTALPPIPPGCEVSLHYDYKEGYYKHTTFTFPNLKQLLYWHADGRISWGPGWPPQTFTCDLPTALSVLSKVNDLIGEVTARASE